MKIIAFLCLSGNEFVGSSAEGINGHENQQQSSVPTKASGLVFTSECCAIMLLVADCSCKAAVRSLRHVWSATKHVWSATSLQNASAMHISTRVLQNHSRSIFTEHLCATLA